MSAERIEQARRNAERARGRVESTLHALQARLHPKVLANDAWDGVREKGNDLADNALEAVKKRPATVSAAIGAFALFLAREPLKRAVTRLVHGAEDEHPDLVTTRVPERKRSYKPATSPRIDAPAKEGVS